MPSQPSPLIQFSLITTSLCYLLAFFFLLHGTLEWALCMVAIGGGCCSVGLKQLRKKKVPQKRPTKSAMFPRA
jgi:hypothetical protein